MAILRCALSLLILSALPAALSAADDLAVHCVACWNLDDGVGRTARDSSGNHYDAQVLGPVQWTGPGRQKGGLWFNGRDTALSLPDAPKAWTAATTIVLFAKLHRAPHGASSSLLARWHRDDASFNLCIRDGRLAFLATGVEPVAGHTALALDVWHHLAMSYDGSQVVLYVDDRRDGGAARALPDGWNQDGEATIGGHPGHTPSSLFNGLLDGIALYDQALNRHQIASLNPAAQPDAPQQVAGILTDEQKQWILVEGDGEDGAVRYLPESDGSELLPEVQGGRTRTCFTGNRVILTYREDDAGLRHLLTIAREAGPRDGRMIGSLKDKGEYWLEVKPEDGPAERFFFTWKNGRWDADLASQLVTMAIGEHVAVTFASDERLHAVSVQDLGR